jgi:hypothetical protein
MKSLATILLATTLVAANGSAIANNYGDRITHNSQGEGGGGPTNFGMNPQHCCPAGLRVHGSGQAVNWGAVRNFFFGGGGGNHDQGGAPSQSGVGRNSGNFGHGGGGTAGGYDPSGRTSGFGH